MRQAARALTKYKKSVIVFLQNANKRGFSIVIKLEEKMKMDNLERKIAQLRAGDLRSFDAVYEKTNRALYFAILFIVHDKGYAEDIMQETYIRAMRSLDRYEEGTNFCAWLVRIGKNLALNHVKRAAREISTDFSAEEYRYGTVETEIPFVFEEAAKVLSEEEYQILMLCQVAGYKRREVAELMGMPVGTVTWKNNEALKKLRRHLSKEGIYEG